MNNFGRKVMPRPVLWAGLCLLSMGAAFLCLRYFPAAFPILTLDLRMDRPSALAAARQLAERQPFAPADYRQAAAFDRDWPVQTYVELEAGGREAFQAMLQSGFYEPYTWSVRHFKPGDIHETWFYFTPRGKPYGFNLKLPEQEPGAALPAEAARTIAEQSATRDWGITLNGYHLAEQSSVTRPAGRVDHTFVYERDQAQIGEGRYRMSLTVGGDRLAALRHSVKIPEAFSRRYAQMRSANQVIQTIGNVGYYGYLALGCGVGLIIALRRRWVIWRTPLYWGLGIAALGCINNLNCWPLIWQDYDTALNVPGFIWDWMLSLTALFAYETIYFTLIFMAAETLTRQAFPGQIQLWRLWSPPVASSRAVLGRTLLGYLLVSIDLLFAIGLYVLMRNWQHWWNPSDTLVEPNMMATFCPWLAPLAIGAHASFSEESLFRAIPIAGAALLGKRFGGRGWWIAAAVLVQAVIFGACHANYPAQPAYARLVEIMVPSLAYAGLYLWLGLLPVILLHFGYDVVLCSLPLFASSVPGIWLDRAPLILGALVPLGVVLAARWRVGRWQEGPAAQAANGAWAPPPGPERPAVDVPSSAGQLSPALTRWALLIGLAGIIITGGFSIRAASVSPPITIKRAEAEARARAALRERQVVLDDSWKVLSVVAAAADDKHRFVWQTAGAQVYGRLLGSYLEPPRWKVRFARFTGGDVAARAEEYYVELAPSNSLYRYAHRLPEQRPGATIAEGTARRLAVAAAGNILKLDAGAFREIAVKPSKLKARTDWKFTFRVPPDNALHEGELRLDVTIAGDQVTDVYRYVHVPETWLRQYRNREQAADIILFACMGFVGLCLVAGFFVALTRWKRCRIAPLFFVLALAAFAVLAGGLWLNQWPATLFQFNTAQPWTAQAWEAASMHIMRKVLLIPAVCALLAAMVWRWDQPVPALPGRTALVWGGALGAGMAAVLAFINWLAMRQSPPWSEYGAINANLPWLDTVLRAVQEYSLAVFFGLFMVKALNRLTIGWTRRKGWGLALIVAFSLAVAGAGFEEHADWLWLLAGVGLAPLWYAAFVFVLRHEPLLVIPGLAVPVILSLICDGADAVYPYAPWAYGLAILLAGLAAWGLYAVMNAQAKP